MTLLSTQDGERVRGEAFDLAKAFDLGFEWAGTLYCSPQNLEDSRAVGRTLQSDTFAVLNISLEGWNSFESADAGMCEGKRRIKAALAAHRPPATPVTDTDAVRDILARLWCLAEGNNPDDTISDAGHTVLCGLLGGLDPKALAHVDAAVAQVFAHLTPPPQPVEKAKG